MSPNIISYFHVEMTDGAVIHLAWPCRLFKILVPIKKNSNFDVFEKTILQLIHEHVSDVDALHKTTGLPMDFIKLIVQRLHSLGLVEKNLKLTERGKEAVLLIDTIQSQKEWTSIGILVENHTGKILDIIGNDDVNKFVCIDGNYGDNVGIILGTSGESKNINLKKIREISSDKYKEINVIEIKSTFKKFQKRILGCKNTDFLDNFPLNGLSLHSSFDEIKYISEPIDVYLHCIVRFNEGNNFIYVEDGFGYSQILTNALPKDIKNDVRNRLLIKTKDKISSYSQSNKSDIIFNNIKALNNLFKKIQSYTQQEQSKNKNQELLSNQQEFIKLLYDTIEHSFAYVNTTRVFNEWASCIKDSSADNYKQIKHIFIHKFKLKITDDMEKVLMQLSKVSYGQVNSLYFGNVSLIPLLVKSIYACQVLDNHPLIVLLKLQPDLFINLHKLHQLRNKISHGNKLKSLPQDLVSRINEFGIDIVKLLYPKLILTDKENIHYYDRELSQKYLKAEIRLNKHFQDLIPELVRDNLFRLFGLDYVEKDINKQSKEIITETDKLKYIVYLSSSIEKALVFQIEYLMGMGSIPNYQEKEFLEWLDVNKINISATLEKKIKKINQSKIRKMYEYTNTLALLDLFIFYLFLSMSFNDLSLQIMINQEINISETIVKIHQFRGHGNNITDEFCQVNDAQIIKLQEDTFLIIQILTQSY